MNSPDSLASEAARFLEGLWADLGAKARVHRARPGEAPDLWCALDLDGRRVRLAVEVKARYVASEIEKVPTLKRADALLVIPHLGQGARNRLRANGVSHADFSGYVYLNAPGIRVDRERGARQPRLSWSTSTREINPFSKKASRVLLALFSDSGSSIRVSDLAAQTGLAIGWASDVATALVRRGYAEQSLEGVRLTDPVAVLLDWTSVYHWKRNAMRTYAVPFTPTEIVERLSVACAKAHVPWALTLLGAAERRIGYVRGAEVVHAYASADDGAALRVVLEALHAQETSEGNLALLQPYYGASVFSGAEVVDGVSIVSDLQLFLDLARFPVRGVEAAEMLVRRRLAKALNLDLNAVNRLLEGLA